MQGGWPEDPASWNVTIKLQWNVKGEKKKYLNGESERKVLQGYKWILDSLEIVWPKFCTNLLYNILVRKYEGKRPFWETYISGF
jgi:hypothetical protein